MTARRRLFFGVAAASTFVCAVLSGLLVGPLLVPAVLVLAFSFGRG